MAMATWMGVQRNTPTSESPILNANVGESDLFAQMLEQKTLVQRGRNMPPAGLLSF